MKQNKFRRGINKETINEDSVDRIWYGWLIIIFAFSADRLSQTIFRSFCRTPLILEHTLTRLFKLFQSFTDNLLYQY